MTGSLEDLGLGGQRPVMDPTGMVDVDLPSGAPFPVHPSEVGYLTALARRYKEDLHFTNVGDLQDLDRILMGELMCFRWSVWISRGTDYDQHPIDAEDLQRSWVKHSAEVRQTKAQLDITKRARDKAKGEDSVPVYLNNLLARAKEFGILREAQLNRALELFNELKALVKLHRNCDDLERAELHVEMEDVLEWILVVMIPAYDEVDEHFRTHQQKFWVRTL